MKSILSEISRLILTLALAMSALLLFVACSNASASPLNAFTKGFKLASSAVTTGKEIRSLIPPKASSEASSPLRVCAKGSSDQSALGLPTCRQGCVFQATGIYTTDCEGAIVLGLNVAKAPKEKKSK